MKNKKAMTMLTVFALCCGLVCCLTGGETIYGTDEESIISMSKGSCNVSARDILTKGTVSFDENAGFNRDGHILDANIVASGVDGAEYDGQFFAHFGAGYTMKITVDFGTNQVDRLTFRSFGTNETPTVFEVYAGETLLGTGSTGACGNGWLDNVPQLISEQAGKGTIFFSQVVSGIQLITIKVISSASAWPANTVGNFVFRSLPQMKEDMLALSAQEIVLDGQITFDETAGYDPDGHNLSFNTVTAGTAGAEYDGQFFAHFGAGYTMKITVDFGTNQVDRLTFRSFGTNETPTVFEVYAGETLLGTGSTGACGNGWLDNEPGIISEQALKGEILFDEVISGQQNITLKVISSASAWPANTIGCLTFHAQTVDTGDAMAWSVFLIVFLSALSVIRRKIKIQE